MPEKITVKDVIADRFLKSLEAGTAPWHKPWACVQPQNGVSRKPYSGVNCWTLAIWGEDDYYLTFNQIKALGGHLEAGTKGLPISFFSQVEDKKKKAQGVKDAKFLLHKYYTVFPVNKCNLPDFKRANRQITFTPIDEAERLLTLNKFKVNLGGSSAHFSPSSKEITMPKPEAFKSVKHFYATLFHELGHALGNEKQKLNTKFGSPDYAKEELTAELFSAMCINYLGMWESDLFDNSSAYVASWLKELSNDKSLIIKAASQAWERFSEFTGVKEEQEQETEA